MRKLTYILQLSFSCVILLTSGCKRENVESKFYAQDSPEKQYFSNKVYPILNSKCFSCHNYHNSAASRYDTYTKAAAVAQEMASRIHASDGNMMPPLSSAPLTEGEKDVLNTFFKLVQGDQTKDYQVSISWTAYKFPDFATRAGVTGTFGDIYIKYNSQSPADIWEHLKNAEIIINSNSVNVNNDSTKNWNLKNYFFSFFTPVIYGKVLDVNPADKKVIVKITMHGISKNIPFAITEEGENLTFAGSISNLNDFNAQSAFKALQNACGIYHDNKVWPDISLEAEIKNFKNFPR